MINFFRQIRQRYLSQNKFSRYLLYAIGEIVLVVLGILIAVYINRIYTNKVNDQLEINYLSAILNNIEEDIDDLQQRLKKDSVHLHSYTLLIQAFTSDSLKSNEVALKNIIHNSAVINYFNPQNTVFEEMKSSGNLKLIKLGALRYGIMEYYNRSKKVNASQEINNNFIMKHRDKSIDKHLDMNSLVESKLPKQWSTELSPFDNSFFMKDILDPEVEAFGKEISLMKAGVWINHNWKTGLLKYAEKIKVEIEQYLSSKE